LNIEIKSGFGTLFIQFISFTIFFKYYIVNIRRNSTFVL
jgi:hypothetical protein